MNANIELLLDETRGINIPHDFVTSVDLEDWGLDETDEDVITCHNPENEGYWDAWASICDQAEFTRNHKTWTLHQDGCLFAVAWDELTDEEYKEFMGEDRDDAIEEDHLPAMHYLTEYGGMSWKEAKERYEEVNIYKGRLLEAATEFFDERYLTDVPEEVQPYIDYETFANDCRVDGDMFEFEYEGTTYTCTNSNEL